MKLEKITKQDSAIGRSYHDACGAAHALDLVGERWALLVMRELMLGPKRFSDLRGDLPGISANVLTQRLEGLEAAGLLVRRKLPPPAAAQVYELTPWGYEAEPIMAALGRWATRSPLHDPTLPLSATSLMLSFRTMFDPGRAGDFAVRIAFRLGDERFLVSVGEGLIEARRAAEGDPPAAVTVAGEPPAVAAVVYGGAPLDGMEVSGALVIEGDRAAFARFATLFPLPEKAAPPRP
ncbi:transcriptional regulator [Alsobacter soli]|uniref:Transcriptional regulator n=1 Tax=Alsobacter soli TaxID=2109933 RepID=A0A2T1HNZ9_9HYPH|nr:winged helix-turn-helix transcriptional regulator [Alsobacter soli]PSC03404.1 transcriptional regulator [Alsobacter soli]